jgi:hypothetical protein
MREGEHQVEKAQTTADQQDEGSYWLWWVYIFLDLIPIELTINAPVFHPPSC